MPSIRLVLFALSFVVACESNSGTPFPGEGMGGSASSGGSGGGTATNTGGASSSSTTGGASASTTIASGGATATQSGGNGSATGGATATQSGGNGSATGGATATQSGGNGSASGGTTATQSGGNGSASGGSSGAKTGSGGSSGASGGSSSMAGGTTSSIAGGTSSTGPSKITSDLIGPGGPITSGAKNATHKDLWIGLFSYPSAGENIIGAWFTFKWGTSTCSTTKPNAASNATYGGSPLCASGGNCTGSTPGDGLGFTLCSVAGINTSTWPQMQQLITTGGLSTTGKSTFSQCNGGAKITSVNWTMANGTTTPAGMAVEFMGVNDVSLGKLSNLPAGTTSVPVAGFDASKIAGINFQFDGSLVRAWSVCFEKLTLSYQ